MKKEEKQDAEDGHNSLTNTTFNVLATKELKMQRAISDRVKSKSEQLEQKQ